MAIQIKGTGSGIQIVESNGPITVASVATPQPTFSALKAALQAGVDAYNASQSAATQAGVDANAALNS